jgi:hypothetical protein
MAESMLLLADRRDDDLSHPPSAKAVDEVPRSGCSCRSASHAPGIRGLMTLAIPCSRGTKADWVLVLRNANESWVYGYACPCM